MGNVGIGTTNPGSYGLSVIGGDTNIGCNLFIGGYLNQNNSSQSNIFMGNVGIGTTTTISSLELYSTNRNQPRLILSGQEYFSTTAITTGGIAFVCAVNRSSNRQLYIGDSERLVNNTTNPVIRIAISNSPSIDACATNGSTIFPLIIGNSLNTLTLRGSTIILLNNANITGNLTITSNLITSNYINSLTIYENSIPLTSKYIQYNQPNNSNIIINSIKSASVERQYPPKSYTSSVNETPITFLGKTNVYFEIITLNQLDISYGSGDYFIYSSSTTLASTRQKMNLFNFNLTETTNSTHFATNQYSGGGYNYPTYSNSIINDGYYGDWIIIKLPVSLILTKFRFYARTESLTRAPGEWKCYGSSDGITFTEINAASQSTRLDVSYYANPYYYEKVLTPSITTSYTYFGWTINKLAGSDTILNFAEIQLFGIEPAITTNTAYLSIGTNDTSTYPLNVVGDANLSCNLFIGGSLNQNNSSQSNIFLGSVGIGTTTLNSYKLNVSGSLNANSISSNGIQIDFTSYALSSDLSITSNTLQGYINTNLSNSSNFTIETSNTLQGYINTNLSNSSNFTSNYTYENLNVLDTTIQKLFPPKTYNTASIQSNITYLTQSVYYENITLTTANISYGSGSYDIYTSSIDDTNISFTGTGATSNTVTNNTDYAYIVFPNNGTLTLNSSIVCDILVVGGGGGGGSKAGPGGGAGALIYKTNYNFPAGSYSVNIGAGGAGGTNAAKNPGSNGGDTSIINTNTSTTIFLAKGGGGASAGGAANGTNAGSDTSHNGNNGGSGGGGYKAGIAGVKVTTNIPQDSDVYGNDGASATSSVSYGGGGGGAGGPGNPGAIGSTAQFGNGGLPKLINITNTPTYYAGGGGAGNRYAGFFAGYGGVGTGSASSPSTNGGAGDGGSAGNNGISATANTGSGGGGGGYGGSEPGGSGGAGGSGIVILRFLKSTAKKELFNYITNDYTSYFKSFQYDTNNGYYLTTDKYILTGYYGDWIIIKIPLSIYLSKYRIYNTSLIIGRSPSLFKIYGSTDGNTYEEINDASNTTALTASDYSSGYYEKTVNYFGKTYNYFGIVVNKIIGGDNNSHLLNINEFQIYGVESTPNYIPRYLLYNGTTQTFTGTLTNTGTIINNGTINGSGTISAFSFTQNGTTLNALLNAKQSNLTPTTVLSGIGSNLTLINYYNLSNLPNLSQYATTTSLTNYVLKNGDTMTGALAVAGTLNITGATNSPQYLYFRGTDYNIGIAGATGNFSTWAAQNDMIIRTLTGTKLILQSGNSGGSLCINSANNIGIGTTNPGTYKLNVNGNTNLGGNLDITGSLNQNNSSQSNIFLGNVGIGTTDTTTYKLNINGTVNATEFRGVGSNITQLNYNNITSNKPDLTVYPTSNVCKSLILYDTPNVSKKFGFVCSLSTSIYPNGGTTQYYKYDIDLTKYTTVAYLPNNDPYRIFKINIFKSSCYFGTIINEVPDIISYEIYMSNKATAGNANENAGINICAVGNPINYKLDKIMPNNIFLMKDNSTDFNTLSILSSSILDVRCIISDLLN